MQDEHFQRQWTEGHAQFSYDLHKGLGWLEHKLGTHFPVRAIIGSACESIMQRKARLMAWAVVLGLALGIGAGTVALATTAKASTAIERAEAAPVHLYISRSVLA